MNGLSGNRNGKTGTGQDRKQEDGVGMREQKRQGAARMKIYGRDIREMSDRELRNFRRAIRLRRMRRQKAVAVSVAATAVFCVILAAAISLSTIRSSASSGFKYYTGVTVEAGENLWDMAERYIDYNVYRNKDSYLAEVKHINHLNEDGSIYAGQFLIFPYYSIEYVE